MEDKMHSKHWHIDNGGYTFIYNHDLDSKDNKICLGLTIENSFFGYSVNSMSLTMTNPEMLKEMAKFLLEAADNLEKYNDNKRNGG
jgi:hypothetical protein